MPATATVLSTLVPSKRRDTRPLTESYPWEASLARALARPSMSARDLVNLTRPANLPTLSR